MYYVGTIACDPTYLQHHGIKGMRWGIRRYRNVDGTLTAEGKKRYGSGEGSSETSSADEEKKYDHSKSDKKEMISQAVSMGTAFALSCFVAPLAFATGQYHTGVFAAASAVASGAVLADDVVGVAQASLRKRKVEKEINNSPIDEKTGLHLKGDKNYTEDEDIKMVNPEYRNFDANTKNNCMLCTMTYDMRQRGYNVTAKKASYGYTDEDMNRWYKKVKLENLADAPIDMKKLTVDDLIKIRSPGAAKEFSKKAISKIESQGPNTRGNIMLKWINGGGHSMVYKTDSNGKMMIIDCQTGKKYDSSNDVEEILSHAYYGNFCRLDNLEFNEQTIKEVCR